MRPLKLTLSSFHKAKLFGLMFMSAAIAVLFIVCCVVGLTWLTAHLVSFETGWIDHLFTWIIGILTGIGGWFILPVMTVLISGLFQEKVIFRVEQAQYPESVRTHPIKFWPDLLHDIKFTLMAVMLNILVLPFHLIGIGFVIAILLNSYLLGREFFESAAGYHLGKPKAKVLGQKNRKSVYLNGLAITLMTLIPILNLFVPIIAVVWMVHVYHNLPNVGDNMTRRDNINR